MLTANSTNPSSMRPFDEPPAALGLEIWSLMKSDAGPLVSPGTLLAATARECQWPCRTAGDGNQLPLWRCRCPPTEIGWSGPLWSAARMVRWLASAGHSVLSKAVGWESGRGGPAEQSRRHGDAC